MDIGQMVNNIVDLVNNMKDFVIGLLNIFPAPFNIIFNTFLAIIIVIILVKAVGAFLC